MVDDACQGKGIDSHLLNHLATMARSSEIRYFESEVLAENKPMMRVFKKMGLQLAQGLDQGVYSVILRIEPTEIIEETSAEREKLATVARIRSFLNPHSIALIGASRKAKSVGEGLLQNIMNQRFNGLVYPVNPKVDIMASIKAYHSVLHIPDEVDLAVVAVPA